MIWCELMNLYHMARALVQTHDLTHGGSSWAHRGQKHARLLLVDQVTKPRLDFICPQMFIQLIEDKMEVVPIR